jgi:hypothetical protein
MSSALWVVLVVLAAGVFVVYLRRSMSPHRPPKSTYVCDECNERHCDCRKEE